MTVQFIGRLFIAIASVMPILSCSPIDIANAVTSRDGYTIEQDIAYGVQPRQALDVYRPNNIAEGTPAILFFYGGRWQFGKKEDYLFVGQALASRGFLTLVADYRLYPQVRWREFVNDAGAALAKAVEVADGQPVAISGHSAGAHLAAMAALDEDLQITHAVSKCDVHAFVGLAGPYDFLPLKEADIIDVFGPGEAGPETQPITYANAEDPPALLIHGSDDTTVVPRNSERLAGALASNGIDAKLQIYEGVSHIGLVASFAWPTRFLSPALDDMAAFLQATPVRSNC